MRYIVDDEVIVDTSISTDSPKVDVDVMTGEQVTCSTDLMVGAATLTSEIIVNEPKVDDISLSTPYGVIEDKGLIYRGKTVDNLMINGKAPYGSSEDDAVWTVYINPLDEYGNVVEEEIEVLYNQIWSEIKNVYN